MYLSFVCIFELFGPIVFILLFTLVVNKLTTTTVKNALGSIHSLSACFTLYKTLGASEFTYYHPI